MRTTIFIAVILGMFTFSTAKADELTDAIRDLRWSIEDAERSRSLYDNRWLLRRNYYRQRYYYPSYYYLPRQQSLYGGYLRTFSW